MVVHALDQSPMWRAKSIARALHRIGFEVDIVGMLRNGPLPTASSEDRIRYRSGTSIEEVTSQIDGDAVYAFKPLPSTLMPALKASRFGQKLPILLDVEQDDLGVCGRGFTTRFMRGIRDVGRPPTGYLNSVTHGLRRFCDVVTVSNSTLQHFYGGSKIIHGPSEHIFDPSRVKLSAERCRTRFGLPLERRLVLHTGRPQEDEGFAEIVSATHDAGFDLVLSGDRNDLMFQNARLRLGSRCHLLGRVSQQQMPILFKAVDIVPFPLHDAPSTHVQMPSRLLQAMAMGRSVVVSSVGDLPSIIDSESPSPAGWQVAPANASELVTAFRAIDQSPLARKQRGQAAREIFLREASAESNANRMEELFQSNSRLRPLVELAAQSRPYGNIVPHRRSA